MTVLHEGTPVDSTDPEPFVIGYESDFRQNSTNGTIEFSVDAGALPTNLSVDGRVFDFDDRVPDRDVTPEYDPARDRFVATVNASDLTQGRFDVSLRFGFEMTVIVTDELAVEPEVPDDAAYPPNSSAVAYDDDGDGQISIAELGDAADDSARGQLELPRLGEVATAYALSS